MWNEDCSVSSARAKAKPSTRVSVGSKDAARCGGQLACSAQEKSGSGGDACENGQIEVCCECGADEGPLSKVVRIVELWGQIAKWSCAGGRR